MREGPTASPRKDWILTRRQSTSFSLSASGALISEQNDYSTGWRLKRRHVQSVCIPFSGGWPPFPIMKLLLAAVYMIPWTLANFPKPDLKRHIFYTFGTTYPILQNPLRPSTVHAIVSQPPCPPNSPPSSLPTRSLTSLIPRNNLRLRDLK